MLHYLAKLFETPEIDDPVKNARDIHKHFTRYSRGQFDGPAIKIKQYSSKLTITCSYEYGESKY